MKVLIVNNCFNWVGLGLRHHGCKAIMDSLTKRVTHVGHEIVGYVDRPDGPRKNQIESCNVLIVNGEGTFRDEMINHEPGRIQRLMEGMKLAKEMGRRVYLFNTVWHKMTTRWADVLKSLDGISAREPSSADEIRKLGVKYVEVHIDESYFLPVETVPTEKQDIVAGNFYPGNSVDHFDEDHFLIRDYPRLGLFSHDWSQVVNGLRNSKLYITGQHHGVYAACRARCPFVAFKVNTNKLTSLFRWAGVRIPLLEFGSDLEDIIGWAKKNNSEYQKLFEFMERQKQWKIPA